MSDRKVVKITIDDRQVLVPEGTPILKAALLVKIKIPTLCHLGNLSPTGSCRLCIVEISKSEDNPDHSWIDSACVYPAAEGLYVRTDSPRVIKQRKLILQLLQSRAPDSVEVQALISEYGISGRRFISADEGESNCILCGLCIKVCNEIIKADAIGMAHRGVRKEVLSPFKIAAALCLGCLACVNVCPTGAVEFKIEEKKLVKEDWGVKLNMIFCTDCGTPVGSERHMTKLKEQITVDNDVLNLCPTCRRKKYYSFRGV